MIKHKEALFEIFTAEMATGQKLDGKCDVVLKTNISKLSTKHNKFICLSDFNVLPVETGIVKDKFFVFMQEIICGGVVYEKTNGDVTAEVDAYELAKVVRTILRDNQTLTSTSYPTGVAKSTYIQDTPQEFVFYYDTQCCVHTLRLEIRIHEDNA